LGLKISIATNGNQNGDSSKKLKTELPHTLVISLVGI
jgi:hypothetical protein